LRFGLAAGQGQQSAREANLAVVFPSDFPKKLLDDRSTKRYSVLNVMFSSASGRWTAEIIPFHFFDEAAAERVSAGFARLGCFDIGGQGHESAK